MLRHNIIQTGSNGTRRVSYIRHEWPSGKWRGLRHDDGVSICDTVCLGLGLAWVLRVIKRGRQLLKRARGGYTLRPALVPPYAPASPLLKQEETRNEACSTPACGLKLTRSGPGERTPVRCNICLRAACEI
jgi:hypothetical protein